MGVFVEVARYLIGVVKEVKVFEENNAECQTGVKYFPGRHGTTAAKIPAPCNLWRNPRAGP